MFPAEDRSDVERFAESAIREDGNETQQSHETTREDKMFARFMKMMKDEEGQGLVEYALIIVLVSVALVLALTALTGGISNAFNYAVSSITP